MFGTSDGPGNSGSGPVPPARLPGLSESCLPRGRLQVSDTGMPQDIWMVARTVEDVTPIYPIYHHYFLMVLAWSGAAQLQLDMETVPLNEGEILLLLPYQFHHYTVDVPEDRLWMMISFAGVEPSPYVALRNRPLPITGSMSRIANDIVETRLDTTASHRYRNQRLALLVSSMLNEMLETGRQRRGGDARANELESFALARMREVADHVVAHRHQSITINDLARHFAISASHLRESFKSTIGISLGDFIRRTRIQHTCETLLNTDLTCSEIAAKHGFSSLYTFSRSFKAEFGLSPTAYRKRVRTVTTPV